MKKEFLDYEDAFAMKSLGFDEPCFAQYGMTENGIGFEIWNDENYEQWKDKVKAPTFSQAFRFFRDKYNLFGCVDLQSCTPSHWYFRIDDIVENDYIFHSEDHLLKFDTYEDAEIACIKKIIEILKTTKQ